MGPGLRKQDRASIFLGGRGGYLPTALASIGRVPSLSKRARSRGTSAPSDQVRTNARPFVIPEGCELRPCRMSSLEVLASPGMIEGRANRRASLWRRRDNG